MNALVDFYTNAPENTGWIFALIAIIVIVSIFRPVSFLRVMLYIVLGIVSFTAGLLLGRWIIK